MLMVSVASAALLAASVGACKKSPPTTDGPTLFRSACARCHGKEGRGGPPITFGGPSPRNFHDHAFQASRTDAQIRDAIKNGKGSGMPAFGAAFDDAQLKALVAQVRSFDPEGGK